MPPLKGLNALTPRPPLPFSKRKGEGEKEGIQCIEIKKYFPENLGEIQSASKNWCGRNVRSRQFKKLKYRRKYVLLDFVIDLWSALWKSTGILTMNPLLFSIFNGRGCARGGVRAQCLIRGSEFFVYFFS